MTENRVGFIGYGNMAQAMAKGFLSAEALSPQQIYVCAGNYDKLKKKAQENGVHACQDANEVIQNSDLIIVALKPHMIESVMKPAAHLLAGKILVSVAAGYTYDRYEEILPSGIHHISTIPNTPVSVGEGIIICERKHSLSEEEYHVFETLFSQIGLVQPVEGGLLGIAGTVSGCSPAFVSMFAEALADAGVMHGLSRELAYKLAAQMLAGTGKLMAKTGEHPGVMKDAVCSPGGTTIAGVAALEKCGFRGAVIEAVNAAEGK